MALYDPIRLDQVRTVILKLGVANRGRSIDKNVLSKNEFRRKYAFFQISIFIVLLEIVLSNFRLGQARLGVRLG